MRESLWKTTAQGWQTELISSDGEHWEATIRRQEGVGFGLLLIAQVLRVDHHVLISTNTCPTIADAKIWCERAIEREKD